MRSALRRLFGSRLPVDLSVCERCGADALHPVEWDPRGDPFWRVRVRCAACGDEHVAIAGPTTRMLLERREQERMQRWATTFTAALEQDLIDPSDFVA